MGADEWSLFHVLRTKCRRPLGGWATARLCHVAARRTRSVRASVIVDVLIQRRRDSRAAQRLTRKLLKSAVTPPRVMTTDKLRSYAAARAKMGLRVDHRQHKGLNNRAENAYQPTRRRERNMKRVKSARQAQRLLSVHDQLANLFHIPYPNSVTAGFRRASREQAFAAWREISKTGATA